MADSRSGAIPSDITLSTSQSVRRNSSNDGFEAYTPVSLDTTTTGALINGATEKTTPVDADMVGLMDSEASNVLKKLSWANIKATLLTWLKLGTTIIPQNSPRGYLINGKIVVTDASGITVAIKGLDGNDPSATNPVYCRIGDTVRSITAALSVAKADGTNWCNAGSSELATKEIDYFVYLGYNATDGVVIGFSRIPYATEYDDFSTTSTAQLYCAISTITNAAAGDDYENIGRFAATLSAGAGYTWTVPTFTNKNLIQRPIYETRWLVSGISWNTATFDDGAGGQPTTSEFRYLIRGRSLMTHLRASGTKAATSNNIQSGLVFPITYVNSTEQAKLGTCYIESGNQTGIVTNVSGTYYLIVPANIADNASIGNLSWITEFEI